MLETKNMSVVELFCFKWKSMSVVEIVSLTKAKNTCVVEMF